MRILIIDQCSGRKTYPSGSPVFSHDDLRGTDRSSLLDQDGVAAVKARDLYDGRQQRYIESAVANLRGSGTEVDRYFISAGFGLVEESTLLPPYNVTFQGLPKAEIKDRSRKLGIQTDLENLLQPPSEYDLLFFPLGLDYYTAIDVPDVLGLVGPESFVVLFNQEEIAEGAENIISLPARTEDAQRMDTIAIAVKGVYIQNFAEQVMNGEPVTDADSVRALCESSLTTQSRLDGL